MPKLSRNCYSVWHTKLAHLALRASVVRGLKTDTLDTSSTLGSEELKDRHLGRCFGHQDEGQITFPIWNNEEGAIVIPTPQANYHQPRIGLRGHLALRSVRTEVHLPAIFGSFWGCFALVCLHHQLVFCYEWNAWVCTWRCHILRRSSLTLSILVHLFLAQSNFNECYCPKHWLESVGLIHWKARLKLCAVPSQTLSHCNLGKVSLE